MRRFLNLLKKRRQRLEHDLDRELRDHLERRITDLRQAGLRYWSFGSSQCEFAPLSRDQAAAGSGG
jgi:hypothetical protein